MDADGNMITTRRREEQRFNTAMQRPQMKISNYADDDDPFAACDGDAISDRLFR